MASPPTVDTFDRANQTDWGTSSDSSITWTSGHDGVDGGTGTQIQIVSNQGRNNGNAGVSTPCAYFALTQQNNLHITMNWTYVTRGDSTCFFGAKSSGNGNRNGVGLNINQVSANSLDLCDNGTVKATTSFTFTQGTKYTIELYINTDYSMSLYVYTGAKPGTPTLTCAAFTPGASGTKFQIGNSANATTVFDVDNFSIYVQGTEPSGTVSTSSFGLLGVGA